MPSIISNVVSLPPKTPLKVELPSPAKPAVGTARGEGFEQVLRDVRQKEAAPAAADPRKSASTAAEKSHKSAKAKRAAHSERSRKGEKSEATEGDDEADSSETVDETAGGETTSAAADSEDTTDPTDAEKEEATASAKEGDKKDPAKAAEAAAEQGGAAVQAAADATQQQKQQSQQRQGKADDESGPTVASVDATGTTPGDPKAMSKADVTSPATPVAPSGTSVPAAHKSTVSAIGGPASLAIKPLANAPETEGQIQLNGVNPAPIDATTTPLPPDLEWPEDFDPESSESSPLTKALDKADPVLAVPNDSTPSPIAPGSSKTEAPQPPPISREAQFADDNHENIVKSVRTQLQPTGGTMRIRLDPPELGALQVMVEMRNGTLSATFQTSNDDATQLLSHSLNQLKHMLETQGMSVDKLQVQQAPKSEAGQSKGDDQQNPQQQSADEHASRQEQQRKEMLKRMWRRASGIADPIDFQA